MREHFPADFESETDPLEVFADVIPLAAVMMRARIVAEHTGLTVSEIMQWPDELLQKMHALTRAIMDEYGSDK